MSIFLSFKEIWRNRSRFLLFSLVIALITVLVLFIAGLAEGLANANREYLAKLDAELIVFQENVDLSTAASRLNRQTLLQVRRQPGVAEVGPVGLSNGKVVFMDGRETVDVSLVGIDPGYPGGASALTGNNLRSRRAYETVIDGDFARQSGIELGDMLTIITIQGTEEESYELEVIGISDGRQYFFQPSIFVPMQVWEKIRPQSNVGNNAEITYNIFAVQLEPGLNETSMAAAIQRNVDRVEVVDRVTAYEAAPGYAAQQSTLSTQRAFTLLIGVLVIGGFFQIQTLQKVPNIGMLKAIGASNRTIGIAVVMQIIIVTIIGVFLGSLGTFLLSLALPAGIPIVFSGVSALTAILSLLLIGPIGGLVSVRLALKVEPLMALGLSA